MNELAHDIIAFTFKYNGYPEISLLHMIALHYLGQTSNKQDEHPYVKRSNNSLEFEIKSGDYGVNWAGLRVERDHISLIYSSVDSSTFVAIEQAVSRENTEKTSTAIFWEYQRHDFVDATKDFTKIVKILKH